MSVGLRPFRSIPKTLRDWTRWMREQEIPESSDITITESQISDLQDYVTTTTIKSGTGSPENNVYGSVGQIYLRTDGGTNTTLYVKESGTNTNTGWAEK